MHLHLSSHPAKANKCNNPFTGETKNGTAGTIAGWGGATTGRIAIRRASASLITPPSSPYPRWTYMLTSTNIVIVGGPTRAGRGGGRTSMANDASSAAGDASLLGRLISLTFLDDDAIYWTTRRMRGTRRRISTCRRRRSSPGDAIDAIDCKPGGRRREAGHLDDSCSRGSIWAGSLSASYSNTNATNRDVGGGLCLGLPVRAGTRPVADSITYYDGKWYEDEERDEDGDTNTTRTRRALSYAASRANAMNENTNTLNCDIGPIERW